MEPEQPGSALSRSKPARHTDRHFDDRGRRHVGTRPARFNTCVTRLIRHADRQFCGRRHYGTRLAGSTWTQNTQVQNQTCWFHVDAKNTSPEPDLPVPSWKNAKSGNRRAQAPSKDAKRFQRKQACAGSKRRQKQAGLAPTGLTGFVRSASDPSPVELAVDKPRDPWMTGADQQARRAASATTDNRSSSGRNQHQPGRRENAKAAEVTTNWSMIRP